MGSELEGAGGYRVGDADRNRTADLLKEAHAAGYLTLEEVDERLGAALAARTRGELDRLVADLPPEWRASQGPARPPAGPPGRRRPAPPAGARLAAAARGGPGRPGRAGRGDPRRLVLPVAPAVDLLLLRPPGPRRLASAPLVTTAGSG
jgi:hypothetical protein